MPQGEDEMEKAEKLHMGRNQESSSVRMSKGFVLKLGGGSIVAAVISGGSFAVDHAMGILEEIRDDQTKLKNAIVDTRILVVESVDHIEKMIITTHGVPEAKEPETLTKARNQATRVKAQREVFPEDGSEVE